jgi:PAS domain S-box-containing protein
MTGRFHSPAMHPAKRGRPRVLLSALLIAVPLGIVAVAFLLVSQARQAVDLRHEVEQSYARRLQLQRILSLHQDLETASRGYVLTRQEAFLEPYRIAEPAIDGELARLDRLERDGDAEERLSHLRLHSAEKRRFVRDTINLATSGRASEAAGRVRSGDGRRAMDALRSEIAELQLAEESRLDRLSARSGAARNRLEVTALAILGALLVLLTAATIAIARTTNSRAQALEAVADLSRRRKAILDAAMDGIIILNPSGSIESVNQNAARMFGYAEEEMLRRDVGMLFASPPPVGQVAMQLRQMNLQDGAPGSLQEIPGRCKDGSPLLADVAISAVSLADGMHYVAVVRDMSERKKIERMKAEFVASVSHELRTPLTSIAGSLGLLVGGAGGVLPDRAGRLVEIAHNNSERLVRLINDILDIEKLDAGKMTFNNTRLDLGEIAAQAILANQSYGDRYGVALHLTRPDQPTPIWADADRLMQVLANLISNAAKFSAQNGTVEVRVEAGHTAHTISVIDSGSGIAPEFLGRMFQRFAQADSSDARQKEGTGLGLAIVREIVQRLGGKVTVDSTPGKGSTFTVALPALREQDIGIAPCVLLCEHDPVVAQALAQTIRDNGLTCMIATTAHEALATAASAEFSVILVDADLPGEGGIALVRELRDGPAPSTPILMISAEADGDALSAKVLQIEDWLQKPLSLDQVVQAVNRVIGKLPSAGEGASRLPRVLHVEDDPDIVRLVEAAFEGKATLFAASSVEKARATIARTQLDLAILDLGLTDGSGLALLGDLARTSNGPLPVIIFSAQDADPEVARKVQAFFTKSHTPIDHLVRTVSRLAQGGAATGASA